MNILKLIKDWVEDIIVPENQKVKKLLELDSGTLKELLPGSIVRVKNLVVLFDYQNKFIRLIVKSIKYKNHPGLRKRVAEYLYDEIMELSSNISLFEGTPPLIVPMPMSKKEKQKKGFNQCEELLKEVEKIAGSEIEISYNTLRKTRETARQTTLSREERMTNVKDSMAVNSVLVQNRSIIVLDDVYTTLSSFREAERAFLTSGAKEVYGLFIAH